METERVRLRFTQAGEGTAQVMALREPSGRDELALNGVDTSSALQLIDRLLRGSPSRSAVLTAAGICAADRDALLAALHRLCWGDRILSTLTCSDCGERFDLSFQLSTLQRELYASQGDLPRWRLPLGEDELSCCENRSLEEGARVLAHACGASSGELEQAATALERAAPILDVDLNANCPECGHEQLAHFDLQSFLLQRLLAERESLLDEVHLLAEQYGWSLREILSLTRSARRSLVRRIRDRRRS
ncbi:hypothetical protein [Pelobacter propionicus]|uniref:Uncharacterized protein n=1 Tax=Pelobacter propionicus (strain DSM 2379 / NBRC 103807 / OttBd1) TaxID=338966 RepID=A1AQ17_PELPD|nr:hypothetical protein [Pelobacter propionicus]ABK99437.1 hypothetical protein Ppro_1825 [Pelobacter propionicus DSM 2379]